MNKNQGFLAGTLLAAALLLRPAGTYSPIADDAARQVQAASGLHPDGGGSHDNTPPEGPWLASCSYWASAKSVDVESGSGPPKNPPPQPSPNDQIASAIRESYRPLPDAGCGGDPKLRWGFPQAGSPAAYDPALHVTAIIATIPDPVHTHLAMAFDRTLNVLLQAAADSEYVSSDYWLPWERGAESLKGAENAGNREPGHDPEREREPGLIILKHVPDPEEMESKDNYSNYCAVIFLFLVAETPTLGVDGDQLQNAFAYERQLAGVLRPAVRNGNLAGEKGSPVGPTFSRGAGNDPNSVAIIGPQYSGSAASLGAAIYAEWKHSREPKRTKPPEPALPEPTFFVTATTSSLLSMRQITVPSASAPSPKVKFISFAESGAYAHDRFSDTLNSSGYDPGRYARLIEDNTALGNTLSSQQQDWESKTSVIRIPREISLLRNAEVESDQSAEGASGAVPSPYLHFSAKDTSAQDTAPQFSRENTPLSQEAELMTIARQLEIHKIQFVQIQASNSLDEIFLATFIHRAYPDAQLVLSSDLLMTRDVDNAPFIGSISISPYHLIGIRPSIGSNSTRTYPDPGTVAEYNAAEHTFWRGVHMQQVMKDAPPALSTGCLAGPQPPDSCLRLNYYLLLNTGWPPPSPGDLRSAFLAQAPLWATTVGRDGYYPLGVLDFAGSNQKEFLPEIDSHGDPQRPVHEPATRLEQAYLQGLKPAVVYPALAWTVMSIIVVLLCAAHTVLLCTADYWSPLTRDLDMADNDRPYHRSVYIHGASAALALMVWVLCCPALTEIRIVKVDMKYQFLCCLMILSLVGVVFASFAKTRKYLGWSPAPNDPNPQETESEAWERRACCVVVIVAWATTLLVALVWLFLCCSNAGLFSVYLEGIAFSFRCIHPTTGVSPVVPVLLLLLGWYLWGIFETGRLRFSEAARPHLAPNPLDKLPKTDGLDNRFLIADEDLRQATAGFSAALYDNIESPIFLLRLFPCGARAKVSGLGMLAVLILVLAFFPPFHSIDHFLWRCGRYLGSPYEFFVALLSYPLFLVTLAGWVRLMFVWSTLKNGLLRRLEDQPIRFAFSRIHGLDWMIMLRRVGWHEQWRAMDRGIESMRQMLHHDGFVKNLSYAQLGVLTAKEEIADKAHLALVARKRGGGLPATGDKSSPTNPTRTPVCELAKQLDLHLAELGRELLKTVLIPYWTRERIRLVESETNDEVPITAKRSEIAGSHPHIPMELQAGPACNEPARILLAEEFIAIRYMALIRAVLANMRYSMTFISAAFVLTIVAWNSYPFQPRQIVDWVFTAVLLVFGIGLIRVFAEMHRDPILSRATDTRPNELGWDFYLRIVAFGTIPLLTWLAYEFPDVGSAIYRFLQPGASVFK